ncbi:MAG: 4-hydroxythreonine-4-phosphate dehydrogenase PdxA [Bacteroidales bacterium]
MTHKIVIGITQGDTNGIGYEVIIKALADERILEFCTPIIYGSSKFFGFYKNLILDSKHSLNTNIINTAKDVRYKKINIINCVPDNISVKPGQPTKEASQAAILSLKSAVADLKAGDLDALVTAPINKKNIDKETFGYSGHIEYLIHESGMKDGLMFLCSQCMKVGIVTNHLPLSKVSDSLSQEKILGKLRLMNDSLIKDFNINRPKIAVLGLNPHSGDGGLLGDEEINIISPTIEIARQEKILAYGPYSPDGFFSTGMQKQFDAVLAMYHDQGLIPFKALSFDDGVNFTAGLPFVRTSPDHGIAYDLAGKNIANPMPIKSAIYLAIDVVKNRKLYKEMNSDVLNIKLDERPNTRRVQ